MRIIVFGDVMPSSFVDRLEISEEPVVFIIRDILLP
jgi:hypothetical protein